MLGSSIPAAFRRTWQATAAAAILLELSSIVLILSARPVNIFHQSFDRFHSRYYCERYLAVTLTSLNHAVSSSSCSTSEIFSPPRWRRYSPSARRWARPRLLRRRTAVAVAWRRCRVQSPSVRYLPEWQDPTRRRPRLR